MKVVPLTNFAEWNILETKVNFRPESKKSINIKAAAVRYEYLIGHTSVFLFPGIYRLRCLIDIRQGGISVGLVDTLRNTWAASKNVTHENEFNLVFGVLIPRRFQIIISACNHEKPNAVDVNLGEIRLERSLFDIFFLKHVFSQAYIYIRKFYRLKVKPSYYCTRLYVQKKVGQTKWVLGQVSSTIVPHRNFHVVEVAEIGYAVRSLTYVRYGEQQGYIVSADFGDDTLSFLKLESGRLEKRKVVKFPPLSAPLAVEALPTSGQGDFLLTGLFNLDQSGTLGNKTSLLAADDIASFSNQTFVSNPEKQLQVVSSRDGHWGFRGLSVRHQESSRYRVAAVDREAGMLHSFLVDVAHGMKVESCSELQLPPKVEPVGIGIHWNPGVGRIGYYLNSRHFDNLYTIHQESNGLLHIVDVKTLGGRSRSSVTVAQLKDKISYQVALVLWGGDPLDINTVNSGKIVIGDLDSNLRIKNLEFFSGGVHPTDVACGDFDGDGLDELAVLNYGTGLGLADRSDQGGVEIYKFSDDGLECIAKINVPNPRIAKVIDLDEDGRDELLVSLFFERKVVVLKYI